ncbi:MAG: polysaccharide pyruvyl transferase family protein [Deltaproteobacteria bacterium]|nr:polysaccharide pyruvyl transferase family protein [Deltaproteobacteria bacterium]
MKRPMKIGLLTPYTGGNLGDGAIQEAVIHHIRKRYPEAELFGVTLNPPETERLHRIPCYPLNALQSRYQTSRPAHTGAGSAPAAGKIGHRRSAVSRLAPLFQLFSRLGRGVGYFLTELKLIRRGYRLLKDTDLLIVAGGGQIDDYWGGPWMHPYSLFKWGQLAKAAGTPFVFLSVGVCGLQSAWSRWFIRRALQAAAYRSYRDHWSKQFLADFPGTQQDPVVPDLAFSYEPREGAKAWKADAAAEVVGLSPISFIPPRQASGRTPADHRHYWKTLAAFTAFLVGQGHTVVFFWSERSDQRDIEAIREMLDPEIPPSLKEKVRTADIESVADLIAALSRMDYIVASRLHSVLLAHLLVKPTLAISYDRKVATHMADLQQQDYCLDIQRLDGEELKGRFLDLKNKKGEVTASIGALLKSYGEPLNHQYDRVLRTPGNPG